MHGHLGLGLPLEEGVVQLLVVDVDLAQLGTHLERTKHSFSY